MFANVSSWAVTVGGVAIAIIVIATSTTHLHQTRANIAEASSEIAESRRAMDRLWSSHVQVDQPSASADVFFG